MHFKLNFDLFEGKHLHVIGILDTLGWPVSKLCLHMQRYKMQIDLPKFKYSIEDDLPWKKMEDNLYNENKFKKTPRI